ncbi:MAG: hypothetical protein PVF55_09965 [Desulfobacterales bacterium]
MRGKPVTGVAADRGRPAHSSTGGRGQHPAAPRGGAANPRAVSRASLIAYFLVTDLLAFGVALAQGLVAPGTIYRAGVLVVPLTAGLVVGRRYFSQSSAEALRRKVLLLLTVLSGLALIRAIGFG